MKNRDKLLKKIKDDTNRIPIPESVTPKGVRKTLEEYDKWFAAYTSYFYFPYDFEIWQYSDSGTVAGSESAVDLNISFYDWSSQGR